MDIKGTSTAIHSSHFPFSNSHTANLPKGDGLQQAVLC
jgi:hypothetical protein